MPVYWLLIIGKSKEKSVPGKYSPEIAFVFKFSLHWYKRQKKSIAIPGFVDFSSSVALEPSEPLLFGATLGPGIMESAERKPLTTT
jgi:hypothetical protein